MRVCDVSCTEAPRKLCMVLLAMFVTSIKPAVFTIKKQRALGGIDTGNKYRFPVLMSLLLLK